MIFYLSTCSILPKTNVGFAIGGARACSVDSKIGYLLGSTRVCQKKLPAGNPCLPSTQLCWSPLKDAEEEEGWDEIRFDKKLHSAAVLI